MDTVRMGIVGVGNMGSAHAASLAAGNISGMELTAVCDIQPVKRQWAQQHFPEIPCFSDSTALLESGLADAVLIATPHYFHPEIACAAFERGLHVLTEKPAGVYTQQVREMCRAAKAVGRVFGIMFNQRTNPLFQKARALVREGDLGVPKRLLWEVTNWYRSQYYYDSGDWRATWAGEGGGVLLNQAPHNLDIWQWIFGMPRRIRAVCGYGKYHHIEVEDEAHIYAEYDGGATADFITSTGECPGSNRLEICGDRGKLLIEDGLLRFWRLETPEREFCFTVQENCACPAMTYEEYRGAGPETAHNGILQNFADAVRLGTPLLAPGEEGLHELTLSNAAYLSDWTGEWVELPLDEENFKQRLMEKAAGSCHQPTGRVSSPAGKYEERWNVRW